jgi:hypothetical protein
LGPAILPILATFGHVAPFFMVMVFLIAAFSHASYALSDRGLLDVLMSTYRIGLLGDFEVSEHVLGVEDVMGDATRSEPHPWSGWQHILFVVTGFFLTVVMTNLFIGIVSNAYDYHRDRAGERFIRARASMSLDYMLLPRPRNCILACRCQRRSRGSVTPVDGTDGQSEGESDGDAESAERFLWFCYQGTDEGAFETDTEGSMRSVMHSEALSVKASMSAHMQSMKASVRAESKSLSQQLAEFVIRHGTVAQQAGAPLPSHPPVRLQSPAAAVCLGTPVHLESDTLV